MKETVKHVKFGFWRYLSSGLYLLNLKNASLHCPQVFSGVYFGRPSLQFRTIRVLKGPCLVRSYNFSACDRILLTILYGTFRQVAVAMNLRCFVFSKFYTAISFLLHDNELNICNWWGLHHILKSLQYNVPAPPLCSCNIRALHVNLLNYQTNWNKL